jgi:hypothetical protein
VRWVDRSNSKTHHHANIIAYTRLITVGNPNITNELWRMMDEKEVKRTSLQKVTDLWCEGVNDLGCKWFCELENEQDPDLSPWDGGGLPKRRF